jgi:DNA-binding LytR/AlgR family response regulator
VWFSVTGDSEGKNGLINLPVSEAIFLEFDTSKRCVFVHTQEEKYYMAGTLAYWAESLKSVGFEFEKVDRNIVVQISKIQRMDQTFFLAYFDREITPNTKKITMSQKYFKRIRNLIATINPNAVIVQATF